MMKKIKSLLGKKEGASTILYVIIIFIAILIITAFTDMLIRSFTTSELQSSMDIAGVSSLQTGIDETKLRVEIFEVDSHVVEATYKNLVMKQLNASEKVKSYRFIRTDVENYNSNFGLGISKKNRPQALIDSTMIIVVESSQVFDFFPGAYKTYYDSKDSANFDISYLGKTEDGKVELSVRSVSRIVYR